MTIQTPAHPVIAPFRRPPALVLTAAAVARRHPVLALVLLAVVALTAAVAGALAQARGIHVGAYLYHGGQTSGTSAYLYHGPQPGALVSSDWG